MAVLAADFDAYGFRHGFLCGPCDLGFQPRLYCISPERSICRALAGGDHSAVSTHPKSPVPFLLPQGHP